jgi:hypothetical protein
MLHLNLLIFVFRVIINLPAIYTEKDSVLPEDLHPIGKIAGENAFFGFLPEISGV